MIYGQEFGLEDVNKVAIIRRDVCDGNEAGRDFINHLISCMEHLGFTACLADSDTLMRPAIKSNGQECYEFVLLCTNAALVV